MKKIGFFIILVFLVRVASIFILKLFINDPSFFRLDCDVIALNILSGEGFVFPYLGNICYFYGTSLYPYFVAFIHLITNKNYLTIQIIQAAIAAFSIIPLVFIAKKIFNEKTALVSVLLYCIHPGIIVYTVKINEFVLIISFILTIIYLLTSFEIKKWNLVTAGILVGLGILTKPTLIFLVPAIFIYLIIKKESMKKAFFNLSIIVLLAAIVITPWICRGYMIYNRFIFLTTTKGATLWTGNNPAATGTGLTKDGQSILSAADKDFKKKLFSLNEIEQNQFFKNEAMKYIKTHPAIFFKNIAKKFIYFWSFSPQTGLLYPKPWLIIYKILYYFLAFFFIAGIYFILKNRDYVDIPILVFLFCFFMIISLGQSLYYVDTRHRWIIEPLLMIISSYGITGLFFKRYASFE